MPARRLSGTSHLEPWTLWSGMCRSCNTAWREGTAGGPGAVWESNAGRQLHVERASPALRGESHLATDSAKPTLDRASFSLALDPIRAGFGEAHSASDVNEGLGDALTSTY